jgi:hypothetical protein
LAFKNGLAPFLLDLSFYKDCVFFDTKASHLGIIINFWLLYCEMTIACEEIQTVSRFKRKGTWRNHSTELHGMPWR